MHVQNERNFPQAKRKLTRLITQYYLALCISSLLLFIFSFVILYFPYFKLVTLKTLVILCNTLKKEGRAFGNIGKNISLYCVISLANFRLLFNLLLIRSSTARGSGTSILSRWSLQKLTPQAKLDSEINVPFLLNEHSDLFYFLLHNNSVHIILLNSKKEKITKKLSEGKKDIGGSVQKTVVWNANYDCENNDCTNALRPRRFKRCDFSTNFI